MLANVVLIIRMFVDIVIAALYMKLIYLYCRKRYSDVVEFPYGITVTIHVITSFIVRTVGYDGANEYLFWISFSVLLFSFLIVIVTGIVVVKAPKMKKIQDGLLDADEENKKKKFKRKIWLGIILFIVIMEIVYRIFY